MHFLNSLEVKNFRNLKHQTISFEQQVTIFVGQNGQGKTSILEAIYFLSHGKSFKTSKVEDIKQWKKENNNNTLFIRGIFTSLLGQESIAIEIQDKKKSATINEKKIQTAAEFYGKFCSIIFSPSDLELVQGAPVVRRSFMDRIISACDRKYISELVEYQKTLKQKNATLINAKKNQSIYSAKKQVGIWNELLSSLSVNITEKRIVFSQEINRLFTKYYREIISNKTEENVSLNFKSSAAEEGIVKTKKTIEEELSKAINTDLRMKTSTVGNHRDDLIIEMDCGNGKKAAKSAASQGQARSMVMALKLAARDFISSMRGETPVLLLDDLESELDEKRKQALLSSVLSGRGQVIITATSGGLWEKIAKERENKNVKILYVESGKVGETF